MFMPASRSGLERPAQRVAAGVRRADGSSGVHTAPRQNTRHAVDAQLRGRRPRVARATASVRKPTRPRRGRAPRRRRRTADRRRARARRGCAATSSATSGTRSSPARSAPAIARRRAAPARAPDAAPELDELSRGRAAPPAAAARSDRQHARAVDRRSRRSSSSIDQRRRRSSRTGRQGRRPAGPARSPAPARAASCEEAQVAVGDEARAPAGARAAALGQQRGERAAADRQLVLVARPARSASTRTGSNIESLRASCSPLRYTSATVAMPSKHEHDLAQPSPTLARVEASSETTSPAAVEVDDSQRRARRGDGARHRAPVDQLELHRGRPVRRAIAGGADGELPACQSTLARLAGLRRASQLRRCVSDASSSSLASTPRVAELRLRVELAAPRRAGSESTLQPSTISRDRLASLGAVRRRAATRRASRRLERRADHPHGRERVGVVVLEIALEQRRQIAARAASPKRANGIRRAAGARGAGAAMRAPRRAAPRPRSRGPASKRTSSVYGGSTSAENCRRAGTRRGSPRRRARTARRRGSSAAALLEVDRLRGDRGLDVLAAVARCGGVGQIPRVELDDDRAAAGRSARRSAAAAAGTGCISWMSMPNSSSRSSGGGLKNVHWSPSKSIRTSAAERRQRLVPAGVQQLDDDVGVAVGLEVGALRGVQRVRLIAAGSSPTGCVRPVATRSSVLQQLSRTPAGHRSGSRPWVRSSASTIRSWPKPRHAVCATPPSASSSPYIWPKWSWW